MRPLRLAAIIALGLLLSAPAWAIIVTMNTTAEGGDRPVIIGQTNLPDGTKLMVTLSRKASSYSAQDTATVQNGSFRVGPFSQGGSPLNPGTYDVVVSAAVGLVQPKSVQAIIGKKGEALEGPLVERSEGLGNMVEYRADLKIGDGVASPDLDESARESQKKMLHDWWIESRRYTCDPSSGYAKSKAQSFDWENCHSQCLAQEP
jgi:hypothetical protein